MSIRGKTSVRSNYAITPDSKLDMLDWTLKNPTNNRYVGKIFQGKEARSKITLLKNQLYYLWLQ